MLRLFILWIGLFTLTACGAASKSQIPANTAMMKDLDAWVLVWADEFEGETLDRTRWVPEVSCWGGGNNERQCYTDRSDNIEISGGHLKLKAFKGEFTGVKYPEGHPNFPGGQDTREYTSGKIRTRKLSAWTYGRFEARMKLPEGQGTWPAFWMMSDDDSYGEWPLSGEIDILEAVNLGEKCKSCEGDEGENRTIAALHFGKKWPKNTFRDIRFPLPGGPNAKDDFHVFSVEWGEGQIDWFVDDIKYFSLSSKDWFTAGIDKNTNPNAPFDKPFYLMLNLAVGGGLSEKNNAKGFDPNSFPSELIVDWVRVYQCAPDVKTGLTCMAPR